MRLDLSVPVRRDSRASGGHSVQTHTRAATLERRRVNWPMGTKDVAVWKNRKSAGITPIT
jgi:hypothetical protein